VNRAVGGERQAPPLLKSARNDIEALSLPVAIAIFGDVELRRLEDERSPRAERHDAGDANEMLEKCVRCIGAPIAIGVMKYDDRVIAITTTHDPRRSSNTDADDSRIVDEWNARKIS